MRKNSNLDELFIALEAIRAEEYPELPRALLEDLLKIEYENQDNRVEAQTKALKLIDKYLSKLIVETEKAN
ncbi:MULTISPECIES: DNA modification system-associated small protein [Paenibacillaceae]|uniref:DNA modification system-associated small protein n=1 Tax=Paenibacillaceae TaxID=186822 RepID=UPI0003678DCE|nr:MULTISPECIES: DNA modification system-associated small protein [Paenibacillaceae]